MHPQERELLTNFLDRFTRLPPQTPDPEADAMIRRAVRRPDAAYLLVQQALVHEIGLQQAEQRIQEMEQRIQTLEAERAAATPSRGGGFLGGILGGGQSGQRRGWSDAPVASPPPPPTHSGWGSVPSAGPSSFAPPARGGGGMGFLGTAAATVAGVAGGALLFEGVKNFMNGPSSTGNLNTSNSSPAPTPDQTASNNDNNSFIADDAQSSAWGESTGESSADSGWGDSGGDSGGGSDWG